MRIVFAGTPEPAVPSLEHLVALAAEGAHEVVGVLTRPDAPVGRGRTLRPSPVKAAAQRHGIPVIESDRPWEDEPAAALRALEPDVGAIVAYGALLPASVLEIPRHGWVNLHFSVLPAWRGAAPVQHALMAGDDVTGATTFVLTPGMDTGPVLGVMTETIRPLDTAGDLLERLAHAGPRLLGESLHGLVDGSLEPRPQGEDGVSRAPKLTPADAELRWDQPAHVLARRVAGCSPAPGAWTTFRGQRFKVLLARPVEATGEEPALPPGRLADRGGSLFVGTGSGELELLRVQPPGKPAMDADAWARGARLTQEETLGE